jgi:hypothetical protein
MELEILGQTQIQLVPGQDPSFWQSQIIVWEILNFKPMISASSTADIVFFNLSRYILSARNLTWTTQGIGLLGFV